MCLVDLICLISVSPHNANYSFLHVVNYCDGPPAKINSCRGLVGVITSLLCLYSHRALWHWRPRMYCDFDSCMRFVDSLLISVLQNRLTLTLWLCNGLRLGGRNDERVGRLLRYAAVFGLAVLAMMRGLN